MCGVTMALHKVRKAFLVLVLLFVTLRARCC